MRRPWGSDVQSLCLLVSRRAMRDIRKSSTRLWFFGCASYWPRLLSATWRHTQLYHREQDIQLVVSDPKAFNNIIVTDQPIFEQTEASMQYVFPFEDRCSSPTREARTCRRSDHQSFLQWVRVFQISRDTYQYYHLSRRSPPEATKIARTRIQRQPHATYDPNFLSARKTGTF